MAGGDFPVFSPPRPRSTRAVFPPHPPRPSPVLFHQACASICIQCFSMTVRKLGLLPFSAQLFVFFVIVPPPPFVCIACHVSVLNESPDSLPVVSTAFPTVEMHPVLLISLSHRSFPQKAFLPSLAWAACPEAHPLQWSLSFCHFRDPNQIPCLPYHIYFWGVGRAGHLIWGKHFPQDLSKKRIYGMQNIQVLPWLSKSLF